MDRWSRLALSAFAFCIALMQIGMPVISYARMAQESRLAQIVCSPSGAIRKVVVEPDGTLRESGEPSAHTEHCALCSAGGALLPDMAPASPDLSAGASPICRGDSRQPRRIANLAPPATGPPLPA